MLPKQSGTLHAFSILDNWRRKFRLPELTLLSLVAWIWKSLILDENWKCWVISNANLHDNNSKGLEHSLSLSQLLLQYSLMLIHDSSTSTPETNPSTPISNFSTLECMNMINTVEHITLYEFDKHGRTYNIPLLLLFQMAHQLPSHSSQIRKESDTFT